MQDTFQVLCLLDGTAVVTAGVYITVSGTIHNSSVPRAEIMLLLDESAVLQTILKFRKNGRISASFSVIDPKTGSTFICVTNHYVQSINHRLLCLFVFYFL